MKPFLLVLGVAALVLLVVGIVIETLEFLLYIGLVVLVVSAVLLLLQRLLGSNTH